MAANSSELMINILYRSKCLCVTEPQTNTDDVSMHSIINTTLIDHVAGQGAPDTLFPIMPLTQGTVLYAVTDHDTSFALG